MSINYVHNYHILVDSCGQIDIGSDTLGLSEVFSVFPGRTQGQQKTVPKDGFVKVH